MKKTLLYLLLILTFLPKQTFAQVPKLVEANQKVIKDEFYNNLTFTTILADLEKKHGLKLLYDKEQLKTYNVTHWFQNETVESGLKVILKKLPLKQYVDETGFINIVSKSARVETAVDKQLVGKSEKSNFTLTGRIVDLTNGENLPFASVVVKGEKIGSQSNVDGYFTLLKVPSDTVTLEVSYVGYRTRNFHLNPKIDVNDLKIEIEPAIGVLEEVTVQGEKTEVLKANEVVGMIKMTPKNIAKLPNVGERDPYKGLVLPTLLFLILTLLQLQTDLLSQYYFQRIEHLGKAYLYQTKFL